MDKSPQRYRRHLPGGRISILALLVIVAITLLAIQISRSGLGLLLPRGVTDYLQYWGAARVLVAGGNPYDAVVMGTIEATAGVVGELPVMMFNPPWTLVLMLPYYAIPYGLSSLIWQLVSLIVILCCSIAIWRYYNLPKRYAWIGVLLTLFSFPVGWGLMLGQCNAWLLLGVIGFLVAQRARLDMLAGAALVLLSIKPHIAYLFLIYVVCWVFHERRWRILVGSILALLLMCLIVMCISPVVFIQYLDYIPKLPYSLRSATFGGLLNYVLGTKHLWLQYLPVLATLVAVIVLLIRKRCVSCSQVDRGVKDNHSAVWNLSRIAPWALLVSALTAPYGWTCDKVVLLPVIYAFLAHWREIPRCQRVITAVAYCGAQVVMYALLHFTNGNDAFNYFYPVLLTLLYAWQQIVLHRRSVDNGELVNAH